MSKELISRWFSKLGEAEKDLPLLLSEGNIYTPRTALNEVTRGSALGDKLQALIETGRFGTTAEEEQQVAKIRLKQIFQKDLDKPVFATLSGKTFTRSELLDEIESGTSIGNQWLNNELSHMSMLVGIR
jgi:hypothetical protein